MPAGSGGEETRQLLVAVLEERVDFIANLVSMAVGMVSAPVPGRRPGTD